MELIVAGMILLALGAAAGFFSGLLGIGGGVVIVPGLYYMLRFFDYPDHAMHIAVGTSLLTIIFTGTSSAYAHYKRGAVDTALLRGFLPGVLIGAGIGTLLADVFDTQTLKIVFAVMQILLGLYMIFRSNKIALFQSMPKQPWFTIFSAINSCLATLMGIGGGVLSVTFMTLCNVSIHRAIATASAIGPFIAIAGAAGFLFIGLGATDLPPFNVGYINLAAFALVVVTSVFTAPLGARVAHSLPVPKLKKFFAGFVMVIAVKMLLDVFMQGAG